MEGRERSTGSSPSAERQETIWAQSLCGRGLAWAFVRYSSDYVSQEGQAKAARLGVHAHGCQPAWRWRAEQRSD
jgi:hypothetical protein